MQHSSTNVLSKLQLDKPFLNRPEGLMGMVGLIVGALAVFGLAAYFVFPIITGMIWNTLNLIGAAAILALVCISAKPLSLFVWKMNQRFWRKLHEWTVKTDPIAALYEFLGYFERKLGVVAASVKAVKSVRTSIHESITAERKEAEDLVQRAKGLQGEAGMAQEAEMLQRQAQRVSDRLESMQEQLELVTRFVQFLENYQRALKIKHADVKDQIGDKERKYNLAVQTATAVEAMRSVFGNGGEEQSDFEMALRAVDDKFADTISAMEMLESEASDLMMSIRIDDLSVRKNGAAKLDELERRLQSGVFNPTRSSTVGQSPALLTSKMPHLVLPAGEDGQAQEGGRLFADLYGDGTRGGTRKP